MPQQVSSCLMILALLVSNGEASLDCTDADAPRMNNIGFNIDFINDQDISSDNSPNLL